MGKGQNLAGGISGLGGTERPAEIAAGSDVPLAMEEESLF